MLSDIGLAGLRTDQAADQAADRFTTMTKQMWEDNKARLFPSTTEAAALPADGKSTAKTVASTIGNNAFTR